MIQFNLLPDVKLEFIRARKMKRLVITIATIVAGATLTIMILLFLVVNVIQRQHLNNLGKDIARDSKTLQNTPELDKILTIQNQLNNLTPLHAQKAAASRISGYISQVTPAQVTFSKLEVDMAKHTMTITGAADSLRTVNQFTDTLKFTEYKASDSADEQKPAFSHVVLAEFGRDTKGASYKITLEFDPKIFDNTVTVELKVPSIITTRSITEKPGDLFQPLSNPDENGGVR
jgi:hypothetical protein